MIQCQQEHQQKSQWSSVLCSQNASRWAPSIDRHWRDSLCLAAFPCFGLTEFNLTLEHKHKLEHIKISLQMFPCFTSNIIQLLNYIHLKSISIKLSQIVTSCRGHPWTQRPSYISTTSCIVLRVWHSCRHAPEIASMSCSCHRIVTDDAAHGRPRKIASLILFLSFCHWYSVTFR